MNPKTNVRRRGTDSTQVVVSILRDKESTAEAHRTLQRRLQDAQEEIMCLHEGGIRPPPFSTVCDCRSLTPLLCEGAELGRAQDAHRKWLHSVAEMRSLCEESEALRREKEVLKAQMGQLHQVPMGLCWW